METGQSLFAYTKQKMQEKPKIRPAGSAHLFADGTTIEKLAEALAAEAKPLWRYAGNAAPFDKEQWGKTIKDAWLKKGSFPVLYKEKCVYDKREVAACILLITGCDPSQEEELISLLSAGDISYDGRPLYQLHYKEGFFRLVCLWNRLTAQHISFEEAISSYEKYEAAVVEKMKDKWQELQRAFGHVAVEERNNAEYRQTAFYYSKCEEFWQEAEKWSLPLQLMQQDQLQRLIVLMAHMERTVPGVAHGEQTGIATRNRLTRKDAVRGTKYCEDLQGRCCRKEKWEDAVSMYVEEALPAMGEACWRSVSKLMRAYSECGTYAQGYSPYVASPVRSARNKDVKQYGKVPVFCEDTPIDVNYMSFAVDAEEIRSRIMEQSANTAMIAQLMQPQYRKAGVVFTRQPSSVQQSALSLFLRSYYLWCEGKTKMISQGVERIPLPFYDFKQDMVIRYALACGCPSCEEMGNYLEFTGNAKLNQENAAEKLVSDALEWYAALPYGQKKDTSPIEVVLIMQRYFLYHLAAHCQSKHGFTADGNIVRRYVRKYQHTCLYGPGIPELSAKDHDAGKQECLEAYHSAWFLLMLLLRYVSVGVGSQEKGISLAEDVMQRIFETKEPLEAEYPNGFLLFISEPSEAADEYLEYLADSCQWKENYHRSDRIGRKDISQLLQMLSGHLTILSKVKGSNSSELELLYETGFYVMAVTKEFCDVTEDGDYLYEYRQVLQELQNAAVLWTFAGGCKNFSLPYYEQHYGLNHYKKSHEGADYSEGKRWLRYAHDLREDQQVWHEILSDLETIKKCRAYMEQNSLLEKEEIQAMQMPLERHAAECREVLGDIICHLQGKDGEENLIRQLNYIYHQIRV